MACDSFEGVAGRSRETSASTPVLGKRIAALRVKALGHARTAHRDEVAGMSAPEERAAE